MLTALDDTLWHQLPTTFDHVGTSDPRFFDRYWFAAHAPDGSTALHLTMGAYRNMNVVDAAVVVVHEGRQHNLRASRSFGSRLEPVCGPIRVDAVEPLQEFVLTVGADDGSLAGEITWRGIAPPHEERPHFERHRGRIREEYQRFDQIGTVDGWVQIDGTRIAIDNWWSCRDHSWGVRPRIGIREPVTGPQESLREDGFAMAFLFYSTDRYAGHALLMQRGNDEPYTTGVVLDRASSTERTIVGVVLTAELHEGTRRFRSAALTAELSDGQRLRFDAHALGSAIAMQGLGYSGGYEDSAGLGVWRGEIHVERETWDVSHPAEIVDAHGRVKTHWHRIQPVAVTATTRGETSAGHGSMTVLLSGRLPQYGLA
jgi:hypothetical protein